MGFQHQALPIRYLGVPLITTRLTHTDCLPLVEKITTRIKLWTSASLTYAGRLQLIKVTPLLLPSVLVNNVHPPMHNHQESREHIACIPLERYLPIFNRSKSRLELSLLPPKGGRPGDQKAKSMEQGGNYEAYLAPPNK